MNLPACHSRREFPNGGTTFFCAHPRVHANGQLVTAEVCRICEHWKKPAPATFRNFDPAGVIVRNGPCYFLGDQTGWRPCPTCGGNVQLKVFACRHLLHNSTTYEECSLCRDFENPLPLGKVRTWAVGMTTAPRRQPTLLRSVESLAEAGWTEVRLFAEPETPIPASCAHLPVSRRDGLLGAFPNWYLALSELVLRAPRVDAYFLCQDDVIFSRALRGYLEANLWPAERLGVVSVYSAGPSSSRGPAGFQIDERGWDVGGALALVFPNPAARAFLGHPDVIDHRRRGPGEGMYYIDAVVGSWCVKSGLPFFMHVPSLAQHIGETSTLFPGAANDGPRRASMFLEQIDQNAVSYSPLVQ